MKKLRDRALTIKWALKLSFRINKKVFIFWVGLSIIIAVLPSMALYYNKNVVSVLSRFISSGNGTFQDVVPSIVMLGVILTLSGLSGRINNDLLYMVMYDYYYLGMEEFIMDSVNMVEMKTLMDKEFVDEYRAILRRAGSLTDFMSTSCMLISKIVNISALLFVASQVSALIFMVTFVYAISMVIVNIYFADKARIDVPKLKDVERRAEYFQKAVLIPGIAKEMRIYETKQDMIEQWEQAYQKVEEFDKKYAFWRQIISFLSGIGFYLCMSVMIFYSIYQVYYGNLTVDVFLMLYTLGQNMSTALRSISLNLLEADRGLYALERQRQFITTIPMKEEGSEVETSVMGESDVVFRAEDVSFSYDGKKEVLKNLNFKIKKGEIIALVGCNGSGKTTLVKLLIELYKPTKGKLLFFDKPYDKYKKGFINKSIGMFFQNYYMFHASLRENVGFGDLKSLKNDERIRDAIEKGGAGKILAKFKDGLEQWILRTVVQKGAMLSGGEKQRIAVSRAHMSDKDILIFDEPAAALDPIAEMEQFQTLRKKIEGRTAILISHRVGFARMADRIFVLNDGYLAETGTHTELLKRNGIYAEFFTKQAEWYNTERKEEVAYE